MGRGTGLLQPKWFPKERSGVFGRGPSTPPSPAHLQTLRQNDARWSHWTRGHRGVNWTRVRETAAVYSLSFSFETRGWGGYKRSLRSLPSKEDTSRLPHPVLSLACVSKQTASPLAELPAAPACWQHPSTQLPMSRTGCSKRGKQSPAPLGKAPHSPVLLNPHRSSRVSQGRQPDRGKRK